MKENWKYKKLGEIAEISSGNSAPQGDIFFENGIYPFVRTGDVGKIHFSSNFDTTDDNLNELGIKGLRLFPKGSILFPKSGASTLLNHRVRLSVDAYVVSHLAVIIPNEKIIDGKFLLYHTTTIDSANLVNDISYPSLRTSDLENLSIPVPPLSVQRQIVAELDLLSDIIEKQKQQIAELDKLAQATFYDMFGDPVTNEKGWEVKKLGETGEIIAGSTPSTSDASNWDGNINWVTPAEIGGTLYYGETERKITEKAAQSLVLMPKGTVLLSTRAPIGKLAITTVPMCCNQGFKNIICSKSLNNIYLYFYLSLTMEHIKALGRGATFKEVSKRDISVYSVILPPISLQQSFASKIEAIERQKELISNSIKESRKLFDSRMEYWFG